MNNTAVIYESKYGSTKRYAEWIGRSLSCPVFPRKQFNPRSITRYNTIIYGGGLYAGGVSGIKFVIRNWNKLSNKNVILFTCGLADPENPDNISHIQNSLSKILPEEILTHLHLFHLRGGLNYPRLSLLHKFMMSMLRKMLLKKDPGSLTEEDRQLLNLLETHKESVDFTDRSTIKALTDYCLSLESSRRSNKH